MNNKKISSLILVDNSNFDLNGKSSKTNSQHDHPIFNYAQGRSQGGALGACAPPLGEKMPGGE
jgi:hypothetical protein